MPHRQPTVTPDEVVARIEHLRRTRKWSAARIAFELNYDGIDISRRTVTRHLALVGLHRRRFIDPNGDSNREPRTIHHNYHRPHSTAGGQPPASRLTTGVTNLTASCR